MIHKTIYKLAGSWSYLNNLKSQANETVKKYNACMKPGRWRLCMAEKMMVMRRTKESKAFYQDNMKKACRFKGERYRIKASVVNLFLSIWYYRKKEDSTRQFQADCIMLSANSGVYLYDFETGIVEKHHERDAINLGFLKLQQVGYWNVFDSPVMWLEGNITHERIINSCPVMKPDRKIYLQLIEKYIEYFCQADPVSRVSLRSIAEVYRKNIPGYEFFFTEDILSISVNRYILHGDIYKMNVFYTEEEKLAVIDYMLVGELPFFYDLLLWPCMEIWRCTDWRIWTELRNKNSDIGQEFDKILVMQGIAPRIEIKRAFLVLSAVINLEQAHLQADPQVRNLDEMTRTRIKMIASGLFDWEIKDAGV